MNLSLNLSLGSTKSSRTDFYLKYISQTSFGACDFEVGSTCQANSTHKAVVANSVGAVSYTWAVAGATIASGQGTDTITVTTDSATDDTFNVECTVNDTVTTDVKSYNFTHTRTELPQEAVLISTPNPLELTYDGGTITPVRDFSANDLNFQYDSTPAVLISTPEPLELSYAS